MCVASILNISEETDEDLFLALVGGVCSCEMQVCCKNTFLVIYVVHISLTRIFSEL